MDRNSKGRQSSSLLYRPNWLLTFFHEILTQECCRCLEKKKAGTLSYFIDLIHDLCGPFMTLVEFHPAKLKISTKKVWTRGHRDQKKDLGSIFLLRIFLVD